MGPQSQRKCLTVDAGEEEEVDVIVKISDNAGTGDSAEITLTANSQGSDVSGSDSMIVTLIGKPEVSTLEVLEFTDTTAVLKGELEDLGGAGSVEVWFKWADNEDLLEDAEETEKQSLEESGTFEHMIEGLAPDTTYYFRALAENDAGLDKGEVVEFTTEKEKELAEPKIDDFTFSTRTTGPWLRVNVKWTVSHEDGALETVTSELLDEDGGVLDSATTSVSGDEASGEHNLRTRGAAHTVRLTVTDTGNNKIDDTEPIN